MKTTFYFLLILVIIWKTKSQVLESDPIGRNQLNSLAHLTMKFHKGKLKPQSKYFTCTGVIVHLKFILTAAHCVADYNESKPGVETIKYYFQQVTIRVGTKDVSDHPRFNNNMEVREINRLHVIPHKDYKNVVADRYINDVALIFLNKRLKTSPTIAPARYIRKDTPIAHGVRCVVAGWGHQNTKTDINNKVVYDTGARVARMGQVELLDGRNDENCKRFEYFDFNLQFCYGCPRDRKKCSVAPGDSGGPLICTLRKGEDPMDQNLQYLFAVHSYVTDLQTLINSAAGGFTVGTNLAKFDDKFMRKVFERYLPPAEFEAVYPGQAARGNSEDPVDDEGFVSVRGKKNRGRNNRPVNYNLINSYVIAAATIVGSICIYYL